MIRVLVAIILALTGCQNMRQQEVADGPSLKVMTYNVGGNQSIPELIAGTIIDANPDIVCLQETTNYSEPYYRNVFKGIYPFMDFRISASRNGGGMAFLSKTKPLRMTYIPSNTGWFDGWIMSFKTELGPIEILNVHLRPPVNEDGYPGVSGYLGTEDEREDEIKRFISFRNPELPLLIAGDFNDDDNGRALVWLTKQSMINALSEFDDESTTWKWPTKYKTFTRRLDHIFYTTNLYCYNARVLNDTEASDHFPVIAEFGKLTTR